jgi:hypothetical protein
MELSFDETGKEICHSPLIKQGCFILFFCLFQTLEIAGVLRLFSDESVKSEEICAIAPTHKGFRQSLPILPPRMKQPCPY